MSRELQAVIAALAQAAVLTPRQTEVLIGIAEGKTTKQIAIELKISPKTVESHRSNLMGKLEIYTATGLTRYAIKRGLVEL
jgi:DNA-binding NarL/FixJ family response regulator